MPLLSLDRFEKARAWAITEAAYGDDVPLLALASIELLIGDHQSFTFDGMSKCDFPCFWNGRDRHCHCGTCRVYWVWHPEKKKWRAESP